MEEEQASPAREVYSRTILACQIELEICPELQGNLDMLMQAFFTGKTLRIEQPQIAFTGVEVFRVERRNGPPDKFIFDLRETPHSVRQVNHGSRIITVP
jgi:hypothetical protein